MPWPMSQDYNEAVQSPATSFSDPELKAGQVVCNAMGLPLPCSGNFADVYAVQSPRQKWAVKCFTREIPGIRERYVEVSKYLAQQNLPFMVEFKFIDQGIRVRGQWYPVLKMHWVEGFALNHFVKQQAGNPAVLQTLGQMWVKMAIRLREAHLAHCDLQHGNVLMVPGAKAGMLSLRLVDYDGMCVPALELLKSIEVGHPNFQHPQRLKEGTYNIEVDRFAHLVIATALRAVAVGGPGLWQKFDNGDNLLFKQADLANPSQSPVFRELQGMKDGELRKLVDATAQAAVRPISQVPLLESLVAAPPKTVVSPGGPSKPTTNVFADATAGHRRKAKGKSRGLVWASLAVVMLAAAGGVAFVVSRSGEDKPTTEVASATTPKATSETPAKLPASSENGPVVPPTLPKVETKVEPPKVEPPKTEPPKVEPPKTELPKTELPKTDPPKVEPPKTNPPKTEIVFPTRWKKQALIANQRNSVGAVAVMGNRIITTDDSTIRVWDHTAKAITALTGHGKRINALAVSPDGTVLASAGADRQVRTWNLTTGQTTATFTDHTGAINGLAWSADGSMLASAGETIRLFDIAKGQQRFAYELPTAGGGTFVRSVSWSLDGQTVAGTVRAPSGGTNVRMFAPGVNGWKNPVQGYDVVVFSPDGKLLATGGCGQNRSSIKLWKTTDWTLVHELNGHVGAVRTAVFHPGGKLLITGGDDGTIRLWDVVSGQEANRLDAHSGPVLRLALAADGSLLVSGSADKTAGIWAPDVRLPDTSSAGPKKDPVPTVVKQPDVPIAPVKSPDPADLVRADNLLKELFKADYAKRLAADRLSLAQKLLQQAASTKDDPAARFVCYREACNLAAGVPDPALAMQAIDAMAAEFVVDALALKEDALLLASRAPSTPASNKALYEAATAVMEQALAQDDYDRAITLAKVAQSGAFRGKLPELTAAAARIRDAENLKRDFAAVQAAMKTLVANPDDPAANLVVGKHRFFNRGDAEKGLPLLAKGSDATLKELAVKDLAGGNDAKAQMAIGDGWYDLAESEMGSAKTSLQQRAGHWYQQALPGLTGLDQAKVEQRMKAIGPLETSAPTTTAPDQSWTVLFRSANPANWNKDVNAAADFAMSLSNAPDDIRYLRMSRGNDFIIVPMTKASLGVNSKDEVGFNGSSSDGRGGHHLGIFNLSMRAQNKGEVVVRFPSGLGWGFGHLHIVDAGQGYSWNGQRVAPCVFEIAVKPTDLTEAEAKKLLTK